MSDEYVRGPGLNPKRRTVPSHGPAPCPWPECRCAHTPPCVRGWIDDPDATRPCPVCRPEHHKILTDPMLTRSQKLARIQRLKER